MRLTLGELVQAPDEGLSERRGFVSFMSGQYLLVAFEFKGLQSMSWAEAAHLKPIPRTSKEGIILPPWAHEGSQLIWNQGCITPKGKRIDKRPSVIVSIRRGWIVAVDNRGFPWIFNYADFMENFQEEIPSRFDRQDVA